MKNGGYTDYVVTDKATAMAALDSRQAQSADHPQRHDRAGESDPLLQQQPDGHELDFLINNADTVMDREERTGHDRGAIRIRV